MSGQRDRVVPLDRVVPSGRFTRTFLTGLVLAALAVSFVSVHAVTAGANAAPVLGVLNATGNYYPQERAVGVGAVTITAGWDNAEPSQGTFSTSYIAGVRAKVAAAKAAGMGVVLEPGLQYPPAWVFALPGGTRFVNQYGDVFTGSTPSGQNVANGVTDLSVRAAQGTYLNWLGAQFAPGTFLAVRQGGGPLGELHYPSPNYNGHTNCYWAYDSSSQASSPVPGWSPGTGTIAQAQAFLDSYNGALNEFGIWLNGQLAADFATNELVMLPGWGQRPGGAAQLVASRLTIRSNEFNEGLDWANLLTRLPDPAHSVAYTTYLDAPMVRNTPELTDPADFISTLVGTSLRLGGENTGNGSKAAMNLAIGRARSLNYFIVQWMDEAQLIASGAGRNPGGPTLAELGSAAGADTTSTTTTTPTTTPSTSTTTTDPTTTSTTTPSTTTTTPDGGTGNLSIVVSALPVGLAGHAYQAALRATGGTGPYSWSVHTGRLPVGLSLDRSSGQISGVPAKCGRSNLRLQVSDAAGTSVVAATNLSVAAQGAAPLTTGAVGIAATPDGRGYWIADAAGGVQQFGDAVFAGSMAGQSLNSPINHIVATPDGGGYWLVAADGGTFSFGDAGFFGSTGGMQLKAPVVDIAPTPDGGGYWLVASDGGVFAFGDAAFKGSMGWAQLNSPVVGVSVDSKTGGYWMVASDGAVFAFGSGFFGSGAAVGPHLPIIGIAPVANGTGYWFVAPDGGIFAFGSAAFRGSAGGIPLAAPIVGMASDPATGGYWLVASDGGVFAFGAPFFGSA